MAMVVMKPLGAGNGGTMVKALSSNQDLGILPDSSKPICAQVGERQSCCSINEAILGFEKPSKAHVAVEVVFGFLQQ
jgi:hypothetical protein